MTATYAETDGGPRSEMSPFGDTPKAASPVVKRRGVPGQGGSRPEPPLIERLIATYVTERFQQGTIAPMTVSSYRYNLIAIARAVKVDEPRKLKRHHVDQWLAEAALAPATARTRLSQLRQFCHWLIANGHLKADPTMGVKGPREPRRLPRGLPAADIDCILEACPDTRARLIVLLMVQEGLRRKEVAGLALGDVDRAERTMLIRGKGGHERILPISEETWLALVRYLDEWPATVGPVIRSYRGGGRSGVSPATVGRTVSELMFLTGIKRAARDGRSAHALRHSMATDMLRKGAHIRDVQAALGHASLVNTQRYLPLVVKDLREAMGGRRYRTG